MSAVIDLLLANLDRGYDRRSWHGTSLKGSVRGLTIAEASWRPGKGRHNIWEIAVHAAYWKYAVWRRLTGATRGSFPEKGSNWFPREAHDPAAWKADISLLDRMHRDLRAAVAALDPARLTRVSGRVQQTSVQDLVLGIAAHDLYHAGQIQLLKRLQKTSA